MDCVIDPFNKSHNALFSAFDVKFILFNEKNKFQKKHLTSNAENKAL
jgi:hypothetical protein